MRDPADDPERRTVTGRGAVILCTIMLLLGWMLGNLGASPVELLISSGRVEFHPHEIQSGHVNIGPATVIHLHPENPRLKRLEELKGKDVQVWVKVDSKEVERLKK